MDDDRMAAFSQFLIFVALEALAQKVMSERIVMPYAARIGVAQRYTNYEGFNPGRHGRWVNL